MRVRILLSRSSGACGQERRHGFALLHLAWLALLALAFASPAQAEKGKLRERLTPDVMAVVYPGAERLGPEEGSPPAIAVYRGDKAVAYIFSTLDIIAAPGY
jgi:NosR/NirI family transcriptional regulator, nitrous oxide reductase regulator